MAQTVKRIVLVHGSQHGAWCWELVAPLLAARGYQVQAIDLPGLGEDPTPTEQVTQADFTRRVVETLEDGEGPALLVGHSFGGVSISAAAEAVPERVARLVYLTALLPQAEPGGRSVIAWIQTLGFSAASQAGGPEAMFYHLCPPGITARAVGRLRPQPRTPILEPLTLTPGRWGAVPKTYVACDQDRMIPPDIQRRMWEAVPAIRLRRLNTDHSPFYSDPEGLAAILDEEASAA